MLDGRVRPPDPDQEPLALEQPIVAAPAEPIEPVAATPEVAPDGPEPPGLARAISADASTAWSKLDAAARMLAISSAAAFLVTLIGLPLGVWDSGQFAFIIMFATVVTLVTAFLGASRAAPSRPIGLGSIELWATHVVAVLAVFRAIEIVFDLDQLDEFGGIAGVLLAAGLVAAAVGMVIAFNQRGSDPYAGLRRPDQGTKLAAAGLGLVLLGWAYNLSISFWTMGQAALPLAVLTLAALVILEAPRIQSPVPVSWIGAGIGVFGAILLVGNWNALMTLGRTQLQLDPPDLIGFLAFTAGTALVIAGGVLSGREVWSPPGQASQPPAAGPSTSV